MAVTVNELKKLALDLTEKQRAQLAAVLLNSLPRVPTDENEDVTEALRRDRELESGHSEAISIEQLDASLRPHLNTTKPRLPDRGNSFSGRRRPRQR